MDILTKVQKDNAEQEEKERLERLEFADKCRRDLRTALAGLAMIPESLCKELIEGTVKRQVIPVIKMVRTLTGLGLKESKDLVDAVMPRPQGVQDPVEMQKEINSLRKQLEDANNGFIMERDWRFKAEDKAQALSCKVEELTDQLKKTENECRRQEERRIDAQQRAGNASYLLASYRKVLKDALTHDAVDEALSEADD